MQGRARALIQSLVLAALGAGCPAPEVSSLCPIPESATLAQRQLAACQCSGQVEQATFDSYQQRKLDLLIVIDNSGTMAKKQKSLSDALARLPLLLQGLDAHIGVVTTDVGAWTAPDQPFATSFAGCDSFAGDDGKLQAVSCLDRTGVSAEAVSTCRQLCPDRKFVPTNGTAFLSLTKGRTNVPAAMEPDSRTGQLVDHGLAYALRCMTLVGDGGCILSSPLEAMKRALQHPANSGFLRSDAPLVVILVTDKDDCSVQLSRRQENDPRTRDCTTPSANASFDCFRPAYRCMARSLICKEPLNLVGDKTDCRERSDSYLESVDHYVQFLSTLRGQRSMESIGVWSVPGLHPGGLLKVVQELGLSGSPGLTVARADIAVCQDAADPTSYAGPQLRLSKFSAALQKEFPTSGAFAEANICQPMLVSEVWEQYLGFGFRRRYGLPFSLRELPAVQADGSPACLVGDVPYQEDTGTPQRYFPACSAACCDKLLVDRIGQDGFSEATVSACQAEPSDCFCAGPAQLDSWSPASLQVWRYQNRDPPPATRISVRCLHKGGEGGCG